MNIEELRRRERAIKWWHSGIDLGHGIVTRGTTNPGVHLLPYLHLPADLSGKSVLDIGTWDGFMAFECERRGADRVVATDSYVWQRPNDPLTGWHTGRAGFDLAHEARRSQVVPVECEVLDLSPEKLGTFDIVLFLGILYHMRHPLLALERAAAMTHDLLIVETHTDPVDNSAPSMRFYPGSELNNDQTNWWGPNVACVNEMLLDVGFERIEWAYSVGQRSIFHAYRQGAK